MGYYRDKLLSYLSLKPPSNTPLLVVVVGWLLVQALGVNGQVEVILRGVSYPNNSVLSINDVGEFSNGGALLCTTDRSPCCGTVPNRFGQWYYPDGTQVPNTGTGEDFYRTREDNGTIYLNRRNNATSPTGPFCCELPDSSDMTQRVCFALGVGLLLNGQLYANNDNVTLEEIGEDSAALLCLTDKTDCCSGTETGGGGLGSWRFPNGSLVRNKGDGDSIYRTRGPSMILLHRRNNAQTTGVFRCEIPDANGVEQTLYFGVYPAMTTQLSTTTTMATEPSATTTMATQQPMTTTMATEPPMTTTMATQPPTTTTEATEPPETTTVETQPPTTEVQPPMTTVETQPPGTTTDTQPPMTTVETQPPRTTGTAINTPGPTGTRTKGSSCTGPIAGMAAVIVILLILLIISATINILFYLRIHQNKLDLHSQSPPNLRQDGDYAYAVVWSNSKGVDIDTTQCEAYAVAEKRGRRNRQQGGDTQQGASATYEEVGVDQRGRERLGVTGGGGSAAITSTPGEYMYEEIPTREPAATSHSRYAAVQSGGVADTTEHAQCDTTYEQV